MVNIDQRLMQAKGISPSDVLGALSAQSLVLPSGTAKIGQSEYDILNNIAPRTIEELNNVPIKQVDGAMIYMRDVATVADSFMVQRNIVRQGIQDAVDTGSPKYPDRCNRPKEPRNPGRYGINAPRERDGHRL
jgi:multidrug efflux pump subunit AcrB